MNNNFIDLTQRICIPFGVQCNLHCVYCYRKNGVLPDVPNDYTDIFKEFLVQLEDKIVVASGGEPLLYYPKIVEVFSFLDKSNHKKIMTNGTLLTPEVVNWLNKNNIECHISYDGEYTKELRGFNIFENKRIVDLVKHINLLKVCSVITNKNSDAKVVYDNIVSILDRDDFIYQCEPLNKCGSNTDLLRKDFNFKAFEYSLTQLKMIPNSLYEKIDKDKMYNINYLLDGRIVGMIDMFPYGNILMNKNEFLEVYHNRFKKEEEDCKSCSIYDSCMHVKESKDEFTCKISKIKHELQY